MRKGFTLVEMLIVVVVIVTLMAIVFRLGTIGSDTSRRSRTINKMQRLENCLSGYYAAYGSYPPVHLHGSRDFTLKVNRQGIQQVGDDVEPEKNLSWRSVEAACRSQPIGMAYPYTNRKMEDYVKKVCKIHMERHNSSDPKYAAFKNNPALASEYGALIDNSRISHKRDYSEWTDVQVFRFGLLSYLLPRYLIMLGDGGNTELRTIFNAQSQWKVNNRLPCDFETGAPYDDWNSVLDEISDNRWKIAALPSQTVCARWIQNLEGSVSAQFDKTIFGVSLRDDGVGTEFGVSPDNPWPMIFSGGKSQTGGSGDNSQQYVIDGMTVHDGWGNEFYYYSPAPHQGYVLWSAGPNGKTFPPWIGDEDMKKKLKDSDYKTVQGWIADDIMSMKN